MLNVNKTAFEELESALRKCAADVRNESGLKVVTRKFDDEQLMNAASIALMVLIGTWVKPENVQFL
jgi:hypothetical protein